MLHHLPAPGESYAGLLSALQEPEEKRAPRVCLTCHLSPFTCHLSTPTCSTRGGTVGALGLMVTSTTSWREPNLSPRGLTALAGEEVQTGISTTLLRGSIALAGEEAQTGISTTLLRGSTALAGEEAQMVISTTLLRNSKFLDQQKKIWVQLKTYIFSADTI